MGDNILFDGGALHLGEKICQIGVVVFQFITQVVRKIDFDERVGMMNHFDNCVFDFLNQYRPLIVHQFETFFA